MQCFLKNACSFPWDVMEFGASEKISDDNYGIRCNHVYVACKTPFVVAAKSVESLGGAECFGVVVIEDSHRIRDFIEGPYPPYNKPEALSLHKMIGASAESYLKSTKQCHYLGADEEAGIHSLFIGGNGLCVYISADDAVPMTLLVSWKVLD